MGRDPRETGGIEARGMHPEYVFVRQDKEGRNLPIKKMYGTAWKNARKRAADAWERTHGTPAPDGFRRVRVHDLNHVRPNVCVRRVCRLRIDRLS